MLGKPWGAAAVEFALVLPVLVLLLLGAIDWGYYFYTREVVVNAAREGARAGTTHRDDAVARNDAEITARDYVTRGGLNLSKASPLPNATVTASSVRVTVTYQAGPITGFSGTFVPGTIQAVAEMRR